MDRDLVLRARDGDHGAFSALVEASVSRLHRVARLVLRDEERAADAVQDCLLTAWLDIRSLRDPDRFDAWLHRLLLRACYREADRGRRHRVLEARVSALQSPAKMAPAPDLSDRDYLDRGFRSLTAEHRAVLVVRHYLGLPDQEAADTLGVALGTYKSRLHRATIGLRSALEGEDRRAAATRESLA